MKICGVLLEFNCCNLCDVEKEEGLNELDEIIDCVGMVLINLGRCCDDGERVSKFWGELSMNTYSFSPFACVQATFAIMVSN